MTRKFRLGAMPHKKEVAVNKPHADHVVAFAAQNAAQPCAHRQHYGVGHQVGGQDPGGLIEAAPQPAGNVRQRTLAIDVSSSSMNVARVTVNATAHGFTAWALDEAGGNVNSAVVVATCLSSPAIRIPFRCILRPIGRKKWLRQQQNPPGEKLPGSESWSSRPRFSIGTATPVLPRLR